MIIHSRLPLKPLLIIFILGCLLGAVLLIQPSQAQAQAYTIFLPVVNRAYPLGHDNYEPNDTLPQAYGPLLPGITYVAFNSSLDDHDFYYFDIHTLGKVTIELSNIHAPDSDLDVHLRAQNGLVLGGSWGTTDQEKIEFYPASTGRYWVQVYLWSQSVPSPQVPYFLKASFNGAPGSGDIHGTLSAHGSPVSGAPLRMFLWDSVTYEFRNFFTQTDEIGQYHFRGLGENQDYQVNYSGDLGSDYIGYSFTRQLTSYSAGEVVLAGNLDISPLNLTGPERMAEVALPASFTWTPRPSSPSDSYWMNIFSPGNYEIYYDSPMLGYTGSFTLNSLPAAFVGGETYVWSVGYTLPDGSGGGAYEYWPFRYAAASQAGLTASNAPTFGTPEGNMRFRSWKDQLKSSP